MDTVVSAHCFVNPVRCAVLLFPTASQDQEFSLQATFEVCVLLWLCRHMFHQMWTEQTADQGEATTLKEPSTKCRSVTCQHAHPKVSTHTQTRCVIRLSAQEQHCSTFLHQCLALQQDPHVASTASDAGGTLHTYICRGRQYTTEYICRGRQYATEYMASCITFSLFSLFT